MTLRGAADDAFGSDDDRRIDHRAVEDGGVRALRCFDDAARVRELVVAGANAARTGSICAGWISSLPS